MYRLCALVALLAAAAGRSPAAAQGFDLGDLLGGLGGVRMRVFSHIGFVNTLGPAALHGARRRASGVWWI
jgi:hypothetical protein